MDMESVSSTEVATLLAELDGSGSDRELGAVTKLHDMLGKDFPRYLLQKYTVSKDRAVRGSCVYHATKYAKFSEDAISLARLALQDKSQLVRYGACTLLAYSLRKDLLLELHEILATTPKNSKEDVLAAIDAIANQNHN
jgi:hypothetical protein